MIPLFGFGAALFAQIAGAESPWVGGAVGGVSFAALSMFLIRWILGKQDQGQSEIKEKLDALIDEIRRFRETMDATAKVQLIGYASQKGMGLEMTEQINRLIAENADRSNSGVREAPAHNRRLP